MADMARKSLLSVLAAVVATAFLAPSASADLLAGNLSAPQGPVFPFFDTCRRSAQYTQHTIAPLSPQAYPNNTIQFCFLVTLKPTLCTPENFTLHGLNVTSRCCNTTFAKLKFQVDPLCRPQYMGSQLTVPEQPDFNKLVYPVWDPRAYEYTEVKYTQFGPIPQGVVNGTTFCLTMNTVGPCNITSLLSIAHPTLRARNMFKVALYDRKLDGYECCPTFTYLSAQ